MLTQESTPHHVDPTRIGLVVDVDKYHKTYGLVDHKYSNCVSTDLNGVLRHSLPQLIPGFQ